MAQERPNRLAEWLLLARKQFPVLRDHFDAWFETVREEPRLIWETSAVRFTVYGVSGLLLVWAATSVAGWLAPPPPPSAGPAATTADFHVVCGESSCGFHFVIHKPFGFSKFPVECPQCKRMMGVSARRCTSTACNGKWVAPERSDSGFQCPICGAKFEMKNEPRCIARRG